MYKEQFPNRLKEARKRAGYTQKQVAEELHIYQAQLTRWETGKGEPNIEQLGMLIDFYDINANWLIGTGINIKQ